MRCREEKDKEKWPSLCFIGWSELSLYNIDVLWALYAQLWLFLLECLMGFSKITPSGISNYNFPDADNDSPPSSNLNLDFWSPGLLVVCSDDPYDELHGGNPFQRLPKMSLPCLYLTHRKNLHKLSTTIKVQFAQQCSVFTVNQMLYLQSSAFKILLWTVRHYQFPQLQEYKQTLKLNQLISGKSKTAYSFSLLKNNSLWR